MATERFSFLGDAGVGHYLAIFNADGEIFDWNDSTFKALSAPPTTPATAATEQTDLGGTSKSAFIKDVDLSTLNNTTTPARFRADWYTDTNATALVSNTVEFTVKSSVLSAPESSLISDGFDSAGADPTATPGPTDSYGDKLDWIFAKLANEQTQTTTLQTVASSDGTVISQAPITSDGTTVTREVFSDP